MPDKWAQYAEQPPKADKWAQYAEAPAQQSLPAPSPGVQAELDKPGLPKNYGFTPGNVASNIWQGAKGAVTGAAALGKDLLSNPNWVEGPTSTLNKFVIQPGEAERQKSNEAFAQGDKWGAFGHGLASDLPFVGPWAASLGEQAGTGDIGGAAGQFAGAAGVTKIGGKVAGKALAAPEEINAFIRRAKSLNDVTKAGAGVYQGEVQPPIQKLQAAIQNEGAKTIQGLIDADKADASIKGTGSISTAKTATEAAKAIEETGYEPKPGERDILEKLTSDPTDKIAQGLGYQNADMARARLGAPVWESTVQKIRGSIPELGPGGLTMDEAVKLRSAVGNALNKAQRGGNAKFARVLSGSYDELGKAIGDRAKELGGDQGAKAWDHYNNEFKAYYELRKGITGDMMDSLADRHESIPQLKKFATADLTEVKQAMKKYGLDPTELDKAQADARTIAETHDGLSKKLHGSAYRLMMGGGVAGGVAIGTYALAQGAGMYGFLPYLAATYAGNKLAGDYSGQMETGRIIRKLGHDPESFQVRTPVQGPQQFNINPDEQYGTAKPVGADVFKGDYPKSDIFSPSDKARLLKEARTNRQSRR